jgi:hypothetical protein
MNVTGRLLVGLIAMLATASASAIDSSKPFLCASMQVHECIDGRGCEAVLPEDVAAPTFMRVNVRAKEIHPQKFAVFRALKTGSYCKVLKTGIRTDQMAWDGRCRSRTRLADLSQRLPYCRVRSSFLVPVPSTD